MEYCTEGSYKDIEGTLMYRIRPLQPRLLAVSPLIAALAVFTPLAGYAAPSKYRFTDLGAVPANFIVFTGKGLDLNSKGHIAGASSDPTQIAEIGIPGDGVIDTNATLGGTSSIANAINKSDHRLEYPKRQAENFMPFFGMAST